MRTTVDIPDVTYRMLKAKAAAQGETVKSLLLRGAEFVLSESSSQDLPRLQEPILNKGIPGSLKLDNEMIYDLIGFP